MELTVNRINRGLRYCDAQTGNEILVVFPLPETPRMQPGDTLIIPNFRMDAEVTVLHQPTNESSRVLIRANDVHDLRLPIQHGSSRTPSPERIRAA
jgi:hypothetical protein